MKPVRPLVFVIIGTLLLASCAPFVGQDQPARQPASPSVSTPAAASTATAGASSDAERAVMQAIQQSNGQQQQALARHDPSVLRGAVTGEYFKELAQIQRDMETSRVAAIKLLSLEWGPVTIQEARAQAITYESWQTTYTDGSREQQPRERNVYLLVRQGAEWLIQADDHPDAGSGAPAATSPGGPGTTSRSVVPAADQSQNWSGYAASGGQFTGVSGSWSVPQVSGSVGAADATWVGIGGVESRDLIQAGTDATVVGAGRVRYSAWIELLPAPSQTVPLTVNPGDSISVSLTRQPSGQWLITMANQTTGQRYQTTVTYASSLSTAEWIEEAPASGRRTVALDNFGSVQFQQATAVENGKTISAGQASAKPITMTDRQGARIAVPSTLGGDGASFTVGRVGG